MDERIDYLDIAKALGIIFVVIGHSGLLVGKFIYLFHMPLFFFISGYFYKDKYTLNFFNLIKSRIKSLYIPFIKFEMTFLILHNIFYNLNLYSGNQNVNVPQKIYTVSDYIQNALSILAFNGTELLLSPLWFLTTLFTVNIIFWIISRISMKYDDNLRPILAVLCFCLGNLFTKLKIGFIQDILFVPELINISMVAVFIFYLGYLFRNYENKINFNNKSLMLIVCLLLSLLREYGIMDMRVNSYPDPAFMLMGTLLGIYFTIFIAKNITHQRTTLFLKHVGKHTIPIMALHLLCFKIVGVLQINVLNLPDYSLGNFGIATYKSWWGILYSIAGITIPLLLIYVKNLFPSIK